MHWSNKMKISIKQQKTYYANGDDDQFLFFWLKWNETNKLHKGNILEKEI